MSRSKKYRAIARDFVDSVRQKYGCAKCDETNTVCLEFHHLDPSNKERMISRMISNGRAIDPIREEINKCVCVCRNCHAKIHNGKLKVFKKDLCSV